MELWSVEHSRTLLPAVVIMVLVAMGLRRLIGKKDFRIRMLPMQIITVLLLIMEVGKQAVSLYRGYDLYHLPFHFCSLFLYVMPVMAFYRGKHRARVWEISGALCTAVFLLMMLYPCLIYSAWDIQNLFRDYMAFHTVVFHNLVVLAFILTVALELHGDVEKADNRGVVGFMLVFCTVSASMAHLLKTNYNNFYSCNIPPLETVRLSVQAALGTGAAQLMYVLIVTALDIGFVLGSYALCRLLWRLAAGRKKGIPVCAGEKH